jgi:DNA polymerase-4
VISQREIPKSISRETAFHDDTADIAEIEGMLYYLVERAARAMRALGLKCRALGVRLTYSDRQGERATRGLPSPTRLDKELFALARQMLGGLHSRRASLHSIGVQLSRFSMAHQRQGELFAEPSQEKLANLYACLDRLRQRFGHSVVLAGKSLDAMAGRSRDRYGFILRTPCLTK